MKCKRVLHLLPLEAGGDLPTGKADRIRKHLKGCPACQREFRMYRLSLESTKKLFASQQADWRESEWQKMIEEAARFRQRTATTLAPWPFKKGWALAAMVVVALILTLFAVHPSLFKRPPEKAVVLPVEMRQPEILTLRIVSKETGLKINWFFHKDLKLEVME
jgi:anti-sigma factor RsiW